MDNCLESQVRIARSRRMKRRDLWNLVMVLPNRGLNDQLVTGAFAEAQIMAISRAKKADAVHPARLARPASLVVGVSTPKDGTIGDHDGIECANQWGDYDSAFDNGSRGAIANGSTSQVAALNRELRALETRYFRTREQLDKVAERSDQLRAEMTKVRTHSIKVERENSKLRHLIDRIHTEKKQIEQQAITNRDYAKKIEHKFFMGTPKAQTQNLVHCNLELTAKVKALEKEVRSREDEMYMQQRDLQAALDKSEILKRALETRFEEFKLNGSLHTGILFELSRLQDQNASMALQLGEERKTSKTIEVKLENAKAKQIELEEQLVVRETWVGSLENDRAELTEKLANTENEKQTLAFEKATLLKFIQEQARVKFQLEAEIKRAQDAKLADLEDFHSKLQLGIEEKQKLQESINDLLVKVERAQLEIQTLEKSLRAEQHTSNELRTRQHELFLDTQRLHDEVKQRDEDLTAAKSVCQQLQITIEAQQQHEQELQSRVDELEAIITALEQEIVQRKEDETQLRTAMENALKDLEVLSRQRNEATRAMNEAVTISASSLEEQQALENKVETQRQQLEQLKHSKNLLQNAMLEQLSALRKQLQVERMHRVEAEAKLKQQRQSSASTLGVGPAVSPSIFSLEPSPKSISSPALPATSPITPTPSFNASPACEDPQPLPPPEISQPSPLPPHLVMLQATHSSRLASSGSPSSSSSDSETETTRDVFTEEMHVATARERTPERTIPSPSDNLSLLELAGDV